MGQKVLILGESGTGKSASLRNFDENEVFVINAAGKPLPFKSHIKCFTPRYENMTRDIMTAMDSTDKKVIVIDDAQYIMSFQYMRRIKENGWDKWNDIQADFFNIIKHVDDLPDDVVVYFLSHVQKDDSGFEKIKTMGKMLDEKITLEGLFTTVLASSVQDGQYFFLTQNNGRNTVKSPIGMFSSYAIDNDLKYVDTKIRNYYEIGDFVDNETVQKMDQEAEKESVTEKAVGGRRRRRKDAEVENTVEEAGLGTSDGQGIVSEPAQGSGQNDSGSGTEEGVTRKRRTRSSATTESVTIGVPPEGLTEPEKSTVDNPEQVVENNTAEADPVVQSETAPRRRRRRNTITKQDVEYIEGFSEENIPF